MSHSLPMVDGVAVVAPSWTVRVGVVQGLYVGLPRPVPGWGWGRPLDHSLDRRGGKGASGICERAAPHRLAPANV